MTIESKFLSMEGEIIESSVHNLAIDLHRQGKIEFIAASSSEISNRREKTFYFRHNDRMMKLRARDAKNYFLALVNDRPRQSVTERKEFGLT